MTKSDHVTALFMGGCYYWFMDQEDTAAMCWRTAVEILNMSFPLVGEA